MILGIYGKHKSGKTALIEEIIEELGTEYEIATIKHIPGDFSLDTVGTDTWRHGRAGASVVVAGSDGETAVVLKRGSDPSEILDMIRNISSPDLILVEGYKNADIPKILTGGLEPKENTVFEYGEPTPEGVKKIIEHIRDEIAIERIEGALPGLDCGECGEDCRGMAELISKNERAFDDCVVLRAGETVEITVDGKEIPVGGFVREMFRNTLRGMVVSLKGVLEPDEITIKVRKREKR